MNRKFSRLLSAVLAMVMMFSCVTVMNVSSVFAATNDFSSLYDQISNSNLSSNIEFSDEITIGNGCRIIAADSSVTNYTTAVDTRSKVSAVDTVKNSLIITPAASGTMKITYNTQGSSRALYVTEAGAESLNQIEKLTVAATTTTTTSVDVTAGTTYYVNGGGALTFYAIELPDVSGDTYTITGSVTGLSDADTFTLTEVVDEGATPLELTAKVSDNGDSTYTYTATKTAESAPFSASSTFTASKSGYKLTSSTVSLTAVDGNYSFTGTTLTFERDQYNVSGKIVDAVSNTAIAGTAYRTVSGSLTSTAVTTDGFSFDIDNGSSETIYFGADDHYGTAVEYTSASTADVELTPFTGISDGDGVTLSTSIFGITAAAACQAYNVKLTDSYDVNGYTLDGSSGSITVQLYDSSNNAANRLQLQPNATISYTPTADGTLTVDGKSSSSSATDRGYTIVGDDLNGSVTFSGSTEDTTDYTVTADTTYTITATGGAINIYSISFAAETTTTATETVTETETESVTETETESATETETESATESETETSTTADCDTIYRSVTISRGSNDNYVYVNNDQNTSGGWKVAKHNDSTKPGWLEIILGDTATVSITAAADNTKNILISSTLGDAGGTVLCSSSSTTGSVSGLTAGTYYIYNTSGNMTITEIVVTIGDDDSSTTTTEAASEETSEDETESVTETETEETTTGIDYVPKYSSINLGEFVDHISSSGYVTSGTYTLTDNGAYSITFTLDSNSRVYWYDGTDEDTPARDYTNGDILYAVIIGDDDSVTFTIKEDCVIRADVSGGDILVTDEAGNEYTFGAKGGSSTTVAVYSSTLSAGKYTLTKASSSGNVYLSSLYFGDPNIGNNVNELASSSLVTSQDVVEAYGLNYDASTKYVRLVGSITLNDSSDLEGIDAVGFAFVPNDSVTSWENIGYDETDVSYVSRYYSTDVVYDDVWNLTSSIDEASITGLYSNDSSASGIYYFDLLVSTSDTGYTAYAFTISAGEKTKNFLDSSSKVQSVDLSTLNQ